MLRAVVHTHELSRMRDQCLFCWYMSKGGRVTDQSSAVKINTVKKKKTSLPPGGASYNMFNYCSGTLLNISNQTAVEHSDEVFSTFTEVLILQYFVTSKMLLK